MTKSKKIALYGMFAALAATISIFESAISGFLGLPNGIKIGLSNTIVMISACFFGTSCAIFIVFFKAFLTGCVRGVFAMILSGVGGISSTLIVCALIKSKHQIFSYMGLGVVGAITHNAVQLIAVTLLTSTSSWVYYAPLLLTSAVVFGLITGIITKKIGDLKLWDYFLKKALH